MGSGSFYGLGFVVLGFVMSEGVLGSQVKFDM
jgi:hypothetical protein